MNKHMNLIGKKARKACLEKVSTRIKNKVLKRFILLLDKKKNLIFKANQKDMKLTL